MRSPLMGPGLSRVNRGSASGGSGGAEQAPKAIARPDAVAVRPGTAPGRWSTRETGRCIAWSRLSGAVTGR